MSRWGTCPVHGEITSDDVALYGRSDPRMEQRCRLPQWRLDGELVTAAPAVPFSGEVSVDFCNELLVLPVGPES